MTPKEGLEISKDQDLGWDLDVKLPMLNLLFVSPSKISWRVKGNSLLFPRVLIADTTVD